MIKKIVFAGISVLLIWQSYELISKIGEVKISSWLLIIFVAWVINMFVTGIFAIPGFVLPTQRLMPDTYYRIRRPERLLRWYQLLRVDSFRKALLATPWRNKARQKAYFDGTTAGLDTLKLQSKKSEFGHLMPFIILNGVAVYFLFRGQLTLGLATAVFNFIGNFYPVLLQRHHRWRIGRIYQRFSLK